MVDLEGYEGEPNENEIDGNDARNRQKMGKMSTSLINIVIISFFLKPNSGDAIHWAVAELSFSSYHRSVL